MTRHKHPVLAALAAILAIVALLGCAARLLPEDMQSLPYVPYVIALSPWFALVALIAFVLACISRRWFTAVVACACIALQVWWQLPYFRNGHPISGAAMSAVAQVKPSTDDAYARVMTCNVYKGQANAQDIVDAVRDQRVEVLALQETTEPFLKELANAGIYDYLPHSTIANANHKYYSNALFSSSPLESPADAEFESSASDMPAGTVLFDHGRLPVRFVSVHTTSPSTSTWDLWRRSLDEMDVLRSRTDAHYVLMGDFNATTDHAPFRRLLGERFQDASVASGHGLVFTWPANMRFVPAGAGIDHIVTERGVRVGQIKTIHIPGSDHDALLATLEFAQ